MFNRTTSTTFIGRACPESSKVEGTPRNALCHFDRREKSFLDPSHLLRMTGLSPSLGALRVFARGFFLRARRVLRGDTCFSFQVCSFVTLREARKKVQRIELLHGHALGGIETIVFFPMIHFLLQSLAVDERQVRTPEYMRWVGQLLQ